MENTAINIFWFRRDLRLHDNAGLYHALKSGTPVVPIFIFDRNILDDLADRVDARVEFIYDTISAMQNELQKMGSTLRVFYDKPEAVFQSLLGSEKINAVYCNGDYEPYARDRDAVIENMVKAAGSGFYAYKDQVIFEKSEVVKDNGNPYTVFTPYSRKWKSLANDFYTSSYPVEKYHGNFFQEKARNLLTLESMSFTRSEQAIPEKEFPEHLIASYDKTRDIPGIQGTSRLGLHLRFGTISIRELMRTSNLAGGLLLTEQLERFLFFFRKQVGKIKQIGRSGNLSRG